MTYFVTTIREFIFGRRKTVDTDPVYHFFFETSARNRKKVYVSALKKTQKEQSRVSAVAAQKRASELN